MQRDDTTARAAASRAGVDCARALWFSRACLSLVCTLTRVKPPPQDQRRSWGALLVLIGCLAVSPVTAPRLLGQDTPREGKMNSLKLESSAFGPSEGIPRKYTCEGENLAPPLRW